MASVRIGVTCVVPSGNVNEHFGANLCMPNPEIFIVSSLLFDWPGNGGHNMYMFVSIGVEYTIISSKKKNLGIGGDVDFTIAHDCVLVM